MQDQTQEYQRRAREAGKEHKMGAPHIYAWTGLIAALCSRGEAVGALNAQKLREYDLQLKGETLDVTSEQVRHCSNEKTFQSDIRRLVLSVDRCTYRPTIIQALLQTGAILKQGRGPARAMDRELQRALSSMG